MNPVILLVGLIYCALFVIEMRQWNQCPDRHAEIIGWAALALHVVIYTIAYYYLSFFDTLPTLFFNVWSSALRLHGGITLLSFSIARYLRSERRNGC